MALSYDVSTVNIVVVITIIIIIIIMYYYEAVRPIGRITCLARLVQASNRKQKNVENLKLV